MYVCLHVHEYTCLCALHARGSAPQQQNKAPLSEPSLPTLCALLITWGGPCTNSAPTCPPSVAHWRSPDWLVDSQAQRKWGVQGLLIQQHVTMQNLGGGAQTAAEGGGGMLETFPSFPLTPSLSPPHHTHTHTLSPTLSLALPFCVRVTCPCLISCTVCFLEP